MGRRHDLRPAFKVCAAAFPQVGSVPETGCDSEGAGQRRTARSRLARQGERLPRTHAALKHPNWVLGAGTAVPACAVRPKAPGPPAMNSFHAAHKQPFWSIAAMTYLLCITICRFGCAVMCLPTHQHRHKEQPHLARPTEQYGWQLRQQPRRYSGHRPANQGRHASSAWQTSR